MIEAQSRGGFVGYCLGLVEAFAEIPDLKLHVGLTPINYHEFGAYIPEQFVKHNLSGLQNTYWAEAESKLIGKIKPDWVLYFYADTLDIHDAERGFKVAVCVPELQHLAYPFFFAGTERLRRDDAFRAASESADLIFTLSKFVQQDIVQNYGCEEERVKVVYPSAATEFLRGGATPDVIVRTRKKFRLPPRYAIFPGNFWPHKNHSALLAALSLLRQRGMQVPLVLTGDQLAVDQALRKQMDRAISEGWLTVLGNVKNDELHALISGSTCLVFPSLFEGFGIPVAEAMAVGVPVACSNVCSLPEVGGDVAHYFDPNDVESIARVVGEVWKTNDSTLSERAMEQSRRFNYRDSANTLLKALRETPPRGTSSLRHQIISVKEPVLVSIVTPSYQQGQFLRQCIESVLTQDYPHIEYCVFDGGSTDDSRKILESYNNRFFWKSDPDGGQTNAINSGLRRAKGDILAYLNSDDILLPGAVSSVVEEWTRRPKIDLLYGRANCIDENGGIICEYETKEFDIESFKGQCYICQPAAFWHRRIVDHLGLFDERFQTAMDYEYWQRIAINNGAIVLLDKFLACSRDYATTKTRSQRAKMYRDVFKFQWEHYGQIHVWWWRGWLDYVKNERKAFWAGFMPESTCDWIADTLSRQVRPKRYWMEKIRDLAHGSLLQKRHCKAGYHADGWVETRLCFPLNIKRPSKIYLEGICPERKEITVSIRGKKSEIILAQAEKIFRYEREFEPGKYLLRVYSPATLFPGDPRLRSFRLHSTNIFSFR